MLAKRSMAKCFQFLFFVLFNSLFSTPCPALQHSCSHEQSLLLLEFKETFSIDEFGSPGCFDSYPKTKTWDNNTDCCSWKGVTCDDVSGHVIELDLSCSQLTGSIGISNIFGNLTHLTHLNLSFNSFAGEVPFEILKLTELTSLDLSDNQFTLAPDVFSLLLTNLTKLSRVSLTSLNIFSSIPNNLSASLENVDLGYNKLHGEVPETIFHLPSLKKLSLQRNPQLYGLLPSVRWNSSTTLEWLDLSWIPLGGEMHDSIRKLEVLKKLDLSYCGFSGSLPNGMFTNMPQIETIALAHNRLRGSLPSFPGEMKNLVVLILANNSFTGTIMPSWLSSLPSLKELSLEFNQLSGPVPMELSNLVNLEILDIASNNFSGHLRLDIFSNMKQLDTVSLSHNRLSVVGENNSVLPQSIFTLELASCNITELEFLRSQESIYDIDLSMNNIKEIPSWLWSNWRYNIVLNISYNYISHVEGMHLQQIAVLDIRSNLIRGLFPQLGSFVTYLFISNNQFYGAIPPSILCSLSSMDVLDLSNNNFSGSIPQCVGNMSRRLSVLDMSMNKFEGTIPNTFSGPRLVTLNLHGNRLQGVIPSSLAKCTFLRVLDLGNNDLNDTFPTWLGSLSYLRVLSLRSNNFHGKLSFAAFTSFSKLKILDLSHNQFIGTLPHMLFESFTSLMEIDETSMPAAIYIGDFPFYKDSTVVVNKGLQVELVRILTTWTTIDLSSNKFEGNLPSSIGSLISLRQLNVSNNKFSGEIPISVGNLSLLESLDMSSNQFIGTIPTHLTTLHSLSKLNVSHNRLTGRIPGGPQFQTFENDSYIGNDGLCGLPLSKFCEGDKVHSPDLSQSPEQDDSGFMDGFGWKPVLTGYGVGIVFGLGIGWLMFLTGKPQLLMRFVEEEEHRIVMKRRRRNRISKRNINVRKN